MIGGAVQPRIGQSRRRRTWSLSASKLHHRPPCAQRLPVAGSVSGASVSALDYHHCSSASGGPSGDLLVALRNLDVVLCFAAGGGGGLRWTLASTDAMSDFAFAHDIDKFYTPHSAVELDDGRILLIDDGKSRPGCTVAQNYAGCWSRAALYSLDFDTMSVSLDWQFEDPLSLDNAQTTSGVGAS